MRKARAATLVLLLPALFHGVTAHAATAQQDYVLHCMGCHLADGSGSPPDIPDFRNRLGDYLKVPGGRAYLVQVPGASQALLTDARLADVINWTIDNLAGDSRPDAYQPMDAAFVAQHRRSPPADIDAAREHFNRLIEALPD